MIDSMTYLLSKTKAATKDKPVHFWDDRDKCWAEDRSKFAKLIEV